MALGQRIRSLPRPLLIGACVLMVLTIGAVDYWTGWELSLFVLYAFPIFGGVWFAGVPTGLFLALLSSVTWWLANAYDNPYATWWGYPLAALSRLAYFVFVVVGGSALRTQQEVSLGRITALERTRQLEADLVRASEQEQRRIGQDLHDGLCQYLAAISFAAASLKTDLETKNLPEARAAEEIEGLLKNSIVEARDLARGIFPVRLSEDGLCMALEELAANTSRLRKVGITVKFREGLRFADPATELHLYRIAQESIANSIRHGGARNIDVTLSEGDGLFMMTVTDDGKGMSAASQSSSEGMGLETMRCRAQLIGAQLDVSSNPAGGVIISCARKTPDTASAPNTESSL
jgi:signal transduction histidine kinase